VFLKPFNAAIPKQSPLGEPFLGKGSAICVKSAFAHPPNLFGLHEASPLKHAEMLLNSGQAHRERCRQLPQ
jgi:hypothetical protein